MMSRWLWSLIPGPVVQFLTDSGKEVNKSSRILSSRVGSKFNCSRLKSAAIFRRSSLSDFLGFSWMWEREVQLIPGRLKSPPKKRGVFGNFSRTFESDKFSSWRSQEFALGV